MCDFNIFLKFYFKFDFSFHIVPIVDLHSKMPPDNSDSYDLQLRVSVRDLKHLKLKLSYDIIIIYSIKDAENANMLHPRNIKIDLEKNGFSCWFSETPEEITIDSMAILIRNSNLILFCLSDEFVSDKRCCELFNYAKSTLEKNYILVLLGDSFEWQKSEIGALIAHEFFVKINKIERYKSVLPRLIELVNKKIDADKIKKNKTESFPQIFISYCRLNSQVLIFILFCL